MKKILFGLIVSLVSVSVIATPQAFSAEKIAGEVCVEHTCTMKNCTMHVRVHIKPGERIVCPVCGEYIAATNGKLVMVASMLLESI